MGRQRLTVTRWLEGGYLAICEQQPSESTECECELIVLLVCVGCMNDVPIRGVTPYDCRVGGEDLWVGEVCTHV